MSLAVAKSRYDPAADEDQKARGKEAGFVDRRPVVRVAGRVMLSRDNGKLIWLNLRDASGDLQVAVSERDCPLNRETGSGGIELARLTDLGDLVVAEGPIVKTRTGEVTVWAGSLWPGAKSLVTPPEKWAGLQDAEVRYRQRYVDMWATPETVRAFQLRSKIVAQVRRYLDERGFLEVETPVLQPIAGGAAARPFKTHINALDMPLFMRIAPELYLKRLLVGGMPRVYEVSRNFRNEGVDRSHNPEFTSLEVYEAYGDYNTMMGLVEGMIRSCAEVAARELGYDAPRLPFGDLTIDYAKPFRRVRFEELFERAIGCSMRDESAVMRAAKDRHVKTADQKGTALAPILIVNELFEEHAEALIDPSEPTFVLDYPSVLSPLTRPREDDPVLAERFDLFIGGMEVGPAYTELNDPDVQAAKFREQLAGIDDEESTFRTYDEDFVHALRVGMPPAGGLGVGIDRLAMLLLNQRSIRDVILFPLMRPADRAADAGPA